MFKKTLVIFAKEPQLGFVKTRLSPLLSQEEILELYRSLLLDKIELAKKLKGVHFYLALYSPKEKKRLSGIVSKNFKIIHQKGKDLGERLKNVFFQLFEEKCSLVFTDTDTPTLLESELEQSFELLSKFDVVIGPSQDGGYYLIGLRTFCPSLFDNISWGTPLVLKQTLTQVKNLKLKVKLLSRKYDLDRPEDLKKALLEINKSSCNIKISAPRTFKFLSQIRPSLASRLNQIEI